jgi:hypothetical protein
MASLRFSSLQSRRLFESPLRNGTRIRARTYSTMLTAEFNAPLDDSGELETTLTFPEEPLGIPASAGFGYYQARLGNVLGPGGRFKLETKLGVGVASSVWLVRDLRFATFHRIYPHATPHTNDFPVRIATSLSRF